MIQNIHPGSRLYVVFLLVYMLTVHFQRIQMNHSCLPVNNSRDLVGVQTFSTLILNTIYFL
jgi:hypothetical protein